MSKKLNEMSLEEMWELFPIILTEPNKSWNDWFADESKTIVNALLDVQIRRISHIGSTAIGNILAKPTVDILLEVESTVHFSIVKSVLEKTGYLCMSEDSAQSRMSFCKGYTENGFAEKVFHLHLRHAGDHDELYFRDYLLENEKVRKEYEALKKMLCALYRNNRDQYTYEKTEFVTKCTNEAKIIYVNRYE